jgi:tetratricopeptide (TPR) repeat protein
MIRKGLSTYRCIAPFILLLIFVSFDLHSQWIGDPSIDDHTRKGIDFVYNLEFDKAETEFKNITRDYPRHPAGYFFLAMIDWWRILIDIDNESSDERFYSKLDYVIDLSDSMLDRNPDDVAALFFKGGALGFEGRLRANRNKWVQAANDGRQALPIVQRAYRIAPGNFDILLGMGIYNYYAAVIPEQFPAVKPLMVLFPTGEKKKGIEQLIMAGENAKYAAIESNYFLLQLYYSFEKQYEKSLDLSLKLFYRFPKNTVFHRYIGRSYVSLGMWSEACAAFSSILARCGTGPSGQTGYGPSAKREAYYYLGVCSMNAGRLDDALQNFYRCDELSRPLDKNGESGFMSMANLKVGMIFDLQKKRNYAVEQYKKVLRMKNFESSHDLADKYLKTPNQP